MIQNIGITIFGCEQDEAKTFRTLSLCYGVIPTITSEIISETTAGFATGNRCISVGHKSEVSKATIHALWNAGVKYISTRSIGCNHIDTNAAAKMGISVETVTYSPGSVADYTLMLMLMAIRKTKYTMRAVEQYDFRLDSVRGKELQDMTVGVLGTGRIGKAVIGRLKGFGCRVLACDHRQSIMADYVPLHELLRNSDIITLHMPLSSETLHFIGREQIKEMKQGTFLINTARGALIDTAGLMEALENGKLGGAALDVLEGEEDYFYLNCAQKPIDHPFLHRLQCMPNVIITPHTAYYTEQALRDTTEITIKNCLKFERSLMHE